MIYIGYGWQWVLTECEIAERLIMLTASVDACVTSQADDPLRSEAIRRLNYAFGMIEPDEELPMVHLRIFPLS
jgi:hypothetical protein